MRDKMDSYNLLKTMFPRLSNQKNSAVTGPIDIETFTKYEKFIRHHMRMEGLRAIYRGPRQDTSKRYKSSMTLRQDAKYVLLYRKN